MSSVFFSFSNLAWPILYVFSQNKLFRPGNWLVRQVNDDPRLVYIKWDLLERKERLQLEACRGAQKLVTCCSGEGWGFYGHFNSGMGRGSHWPCISRPFSGELVWFAPLLGEGNNLESILLISLVADLHLSFRMQECRSPSPQDAGMIWLPSGMGYSLICLRSPGPIILYILLNFCFYFTLESY
jgi:hypothetical protein